MSDEFKIDGVPSFTQVDNKIVPYGSCFPTSVAMGMRYCLGLADKTKADVGCAESMDLEDYLNLLMDDETTLAWARTTGVSNSWIMQYFKNKTQRQILIVEEYIFNRLMNEFGFKATSSTTLNYDKYCETIEDTQLPIILSGVFSSVSRVGGHIVCGVGFNRKNLKEVIVNDPFGNALDGYPNTEIKAEGVRYPIKFFMKDNAGTMWGLILDRM